MHKAGDDFFQRANAYKTEELRLVFIFGCRDVIHMSNAESLAPAMSTDYYYTIVMYPLFILKKKKKKSKPNVLWM